MVETFPAGVLVPQPAAYPASDVATWGDISAAAVAVHKHCLMNRVDAGMPKFTGWSQIGMFMFFLSIVVFVDVCLFVCWYSDGDERLMVGAFVRSESRYWSVFVG